MFMKQIRLVEAMYKKFVKNLFINHKQAVINKNMVFNVWQTRKRNTAYPDSPTF